MKNKKGFTLIELLAVIVILAIIALIATPIILNMINDAKKSAAIDSAYGYIQAIEYANSVNILDNEKYPKIESGNVADINSSVNVKGTKPTSGEVTIENGKVTSATLIINGYKIKYQNGKATIDGEKTEEEKEELTGPTKRSTLEVGDYVKMTPTSTSFTTDTSKTGYTSTQTINPSELNLWRVIKVNSDGTIEMVSEYVSTNQILFTGPTGYKNLVGYLNVLASQYTNTNYVKSTRHMGYNGQTEYLTDTSNIITSTPAPWTNSTGNSTVESKGGGDTLYTTDTDLVKNAIGTLVATNPSGSRSSYWLASRYYQYIGSNNWYYRGRFVETSGVISSANLLNYYNGFVPITVNIRLRPIVTLKFGISYTPALGTSDDPFVLS